MPNPDGGRGNQCIDRFRGGNGWIGGQNGTFRCYLSPLLNARVATGGAQQVRQLYKKRQMIQGKRVTINNQREFIDWYFMMSRVFWAIHCLSVTAQ